MDLINTFLGDNKYMFYSIKDIKNYILKHYSENGIIFTRKIIIEKGGGAFLVWVSRNKKLKELKINRFYKLLEKLGLKTNKKIKSSNIKKKIKLPISIEKKLLKTQIELNRNKLLYIEGDENIIKEENTYISLFSGGGGGSIGLKQGGYKNLLGIDIDKKQSLLYQHNIGNALNYDITKINFNKLKRVFGKPKILLLSPPCQFFSLSNYRNNNLENKELDEKNIKIFNSIYESVESFNSEFIIFENVPNITTFDFFNTFIKNIEEIGYKSKTYTLKVSDFGGLTIRKRCIVIFSKKDIFNEIDKEITKYKKNNFVEWSGNTLKGVRNSNKYCFENKKSIKDTNRIKEIIDLMKINNNYKTPNKEVIKILKETKGYNIYNSEFYFVSKNIKLMPTLLARPHMIHPSGKRYLTIQELKKIQGYSYNYDFLDLSHRDSAYSIGESISPILTKILGKILIKIK